MRKHYSELPKINPKATKKAFEREIVTYRDFLLTLPTSMQPKVTPSYSLVPPSNTNAFHSSTEDVAIERLEYERARNAFLSDMYEAVNTLKEEERFIMIKCYLEPDLGYDPDIWTEMGLGKTKFYEIKGEAILRLAYALQIEVYYKREG